MQAERTPCARDTGFNRQHLFWHWPDHGRPGIMQACFDLIEDQGRRLDARMLARECRKWGALRNVPAGE